MYFYVYVGNSADTMPIRTPKTKVNLKKKEKFLNSVLKAYMLTFLMIVRCLFVVLFQSDVCVCVCDTIVCFAANGSRMDVPGI